METKTITIRLPRFTYEKLYKLASESKELPSETARGILRETLKGVKEDSEEEVIIAEAIPDTVVVAKAIPYDDDN